MDSEDIVDTEEEVRIIEDIQQSRRKQAKSRKTSKNGALQGKGVYIAAFALASAVGALLIRKIIQKRRQPSRAALLERDLILPEQKLGDGRQALAGLKLICSALFDVENNRSNFEDKSVSRVSAAAVETLLVAGVSLAGRTITEELNLGLLGDLVEGTNPQAPACSISGCSSGAALAVAEGWADIAIGADHLGGIRVQSAAFGLSGFRPTHGAISDKGRTKIAGSLDTVSWLTNDASLHPRIAQTFELPGSNRSFSNTELLQLVVASEVFELFGEVGSQLRKTALQAAKGWAGSDMTATGYLVTYLQKAVKSRTAFVGLNNDGDDVLEGIRRAAVTLQYSELLQEHGYLLEDPEALSPSVLEQLTIAQDVGEDEVAAAEQVREETSYAMRAILRESVLLLPSLPFPQPAQGSEQEELKKWERGTLQLAALAALTGCPQATLPILQRDGKPPLGLTLLSSPKSDQRLAQVAAALAPFIQKAADDSSFQTTSNNSKHQQSTGKKQVNGRIEGSEEAAKEHERLKEEGNAAFKSGAYQDAIEKYSLAIKMHPNNSVLYSNRAQALIKIGHYQEAEDDCTKALQAGPNAKALLRRGTARGLLSKLELAVQDFKHVLALEPSNRQAKIELQGLAQLGDSTANDSGLQGIMGGAVLNTTRSDLSF